MLNLTASPEKLEGKQGAEFGEEKPEGCSEKVEKGELGKDSEEEEEEDDEEEEETSGNSLTTGSCSGNGGRQTSEQSTDLHQTDPY